jgi:hypothetical protein
VDKSFRVVQSVGTIDTPYAMPFEDGNTIWFGTGLTRRVEEIWPTTKNWY